jgi:Spy/CpxP family protein refolding chaperone
MSRNRITHQIAIAAGLLFMGFSPGLARAQSSAPPASQDQSQAEATEHRGHKHGDMAGLNLSEEQKEQMKQVHRATKAQMDAINGDSSLSPEQKQVKIHQIRHHARKQMVKLLTPDLRQQFRENAKARRAARQQNRQGQPQPQAQPQTQQ